MRSTGFDTNDKRIGILLLADFPEKFSPSSSAETIVLLSPKVAGDEIQIKFRKNKNVYSFKNKKNIISYRCSQTGYYKNQCLNMTQNGRNNSINTFSAVFLKWKFSENDWYVYLGASLHLTAKSEWVENISYNETKREITIPNNCTVPLLFTGDVNISTLTDHLVHNIIVKEVFYVPKLTTNLLSVSQLKIANKVS